VKGVAVVDEGLMSMLVERTMSLCRGLNCERNELAPYHKQCPCRVVEEDHRREYEHSQTNELVELEQL